MNTGSTIQIRFNENGFMHEVLSSVKMLKKEKEGEFIYTICGKRIDIAQIISINGISF
jgi:hypothetical protein